MLDPAHGADFTIWLVAALLYVADAARLISPREMLLVEAGRGRLAAAFSASPYTIGGRVLTFAPLLRPWRGVFVARWGSAWIDPARLPPMLASIDGLRGSLRGARVLAAGAFALLFGAGPALTTWLGTAPAILYTAAVLYPTALAAVVLLWRRRRALRLGRLHLVGLCAEILVCPAFLPNLVRKITVREPVPADGAQVLAAAAAADVRAEVFTRLESRTEELIQGADPADPARAELRAYLAAVRAAR